MKVGRTNVLVYDQGLTYNQANTTYEQIGIAYGGIYGADIQPIIARVEANYYQTHSRVKNIVPSIVLASDQSGRSTSERTLGAGMLIGMLGMTYPQDIVVRG